MSERAARKSDAPKNKAIDERVPRFSPYDLLIVGVDNIPLVSPKSEDAEGKHLYMELFDERALMPLSAEKLATARLGIDDPVTYFQWHGLFLVVDGRRRVLYTRTVYDEQTAAGVKVEERASLPGLKYQGGIDEMFARSRVFNVREDEPPLMRARTIARLLAQDLPDGSGGTRKRTAAEAGQLLGRSDQHIRDMMKLFESSDTVKKALTDLKQPTIGLVIADLPEDKQQQVLAELQDMQKAGKKVTVEDAKKRKAAAQGKEMSTPKDKLESLDKSMHRLATMRDKGELPSTDTATKEQLLLTIAELFETLDSMNRTIFKGKLAFPGPVKNQKPGYTLEFLANQGD